jgi:hypothetical protein
MDGARWTVLRSSLARFLVAMALPLFFPGMSVGVEVGDKAPDFELQSTMGGKIRLSDFAGKKNVIIEFHVLDFAPV